MLAVLVLAAAVSAPGLETPTEPGKLGGALLVAASTAAASGDTALRDRWLRAWANLGATPPAPKELAAAAGDAQKWSSAKGQFRLFASRNGDRLKLGVHDPAVVVTRIEAFGRSGEMAATLSRAEDESPGRLELMIDPALGADARFEVRAYCDLLGSPYLIRTVAVGTSAPAPAAPDPNSTRAAPSRLRPVAAGPSVDDQDPLPWWWVVAGVVALSLTGAAIWQETR